MSDELTNQQPQTDSPEAASDDTQFVQLERQISAMSPEAAREKSDLLIHDREFSEKILSGDKNAKRQLDLLTRRGLDVDADADPVADEQARLQSDVPETPSEYLGALPPLHHPLDESEIATRDTLFEAAHEFDFTRNEVRSLVESGQRTADGYGPQWDADRCSDTLARIWGTEDAYAANAAELNALVQAEERKHPGLVDAIVNTGLVHNPQFWTTLLNRVREKGLKRGK